MLINYTIYNRVFYKRQTANEPHIRTAPSERRPGNEWKTVLPIGAVAEEAVVEEEDPVEFPVELSTVYLQKASVSDRTRLTMHTQTGLTYTQSTRTNKHYPGLCSRW